MLQGCDEMLQSGGECYIDSPPPTMSSRATPCLFAQCMLLRRRGFVRMCSCRVALRGSGQISRLGCRWPRSFRIGLRGRGVQAGGHRSGRSLLIPVWWSAMTMVRRRQRKTLLRIVAQAWHKGRKCAPMSCTIQESSDTITLDACWFAQSSTCTAWPP